MTLRDTETCPKCENAIPRGAETCRFCGLVLSSRAGGSPGGSHLDVHEELRALVDARFGHLAESMGERHLSRLTEFLKRSEDEYRTATAVFIDVTGYTALSEKVAPEYVKKVLDAFYEVCTYATSHYNGFVVKFEGDACMAVFGAPVAYDRDAEGAVRAVAEIRDAVETFPAVQGNRIRVSSGVATGVILSGIVKRLGGADFDIFGPSVNLAARIEAATDAGAIQVCPETYDLVQHAFDFGPPVLKEFKNVRDPVPVRELRGVRAYRERGRLRPSFVGRETDMSVLQAAWSEYLRRRQSGECVGERETVGRRVSGVSGIGKTRLVEEFIAGVSGPKRVLRCETAPYDQHVPYGAWRTFVSQVVGRRAGFRSDEFEGYLSEYASQNSLAPPDRANPWLGLRVMFGCSSAILQTQPLESANLKRLVLADLIGLLGALSASDPLIVWFDDVQWIDQTSMELLEHLLAERSMVNAFVLLSHREPLDRALPKALSKLPEIPLGQLAPEAQSRLLAEFRESRGIGAEACKEVARAASGNPLYTVEMLRTVFDGLDEQTSGLKGAAFRQAIRNLIPASLRSTLQSQIDQLAQRRRLVLQCASILGHRFLYDLMEVFEEIRSDLLAQLYALRGLQFLDTADGTDDLEFLFRYHLVRETAYQSMLDGQRKDLHGVVADRIKEAFADRIEDFYDVLAYHYGRSGNGEEAARHARLAGERAARMGAVAEAIEYYDSALSVLLGGQLADSRGGAAAILRLKGRLLRQTGQLDEAGECFRESLALRAESRGDVGPAALYAEIGLTQLARSDWRAAHQSLRRARRLERSSRGARGGTQAMIANGLGYCAWARGDYRRARRWWGRARDVAVKEHVGGIECDARNNLALVSWREGKCGDALRELRRVLRLHRKSGNRFGEALALSNIGIFLEAASRWSEAETCYRQALAASQSMGFLACETASYANLSSLDLSRDRYREAVEHAGRALETARGAGDLSSEAVALENLALGLIGLGDAEGFWQRLGEARQAARAAGDRQREFSLDLVEIEGLIAERGSDLQSARSDLGRLVDLLERARETLSVDSFESERPRFMRLEAMALVLAGKTDRAKGVRDAGLEVCRRQSNRVEAKRLRRLKV